MASHESVSAVIRRYEPEMVANFERQSRLLAMVDRLPAPKLTRRERMARWLRDWQARLHNARMALRGEWPEYDD